MELPFGNKIVDKLLDNAKLLGGVGGFFTWGFTGQGSPFESIQQALAGQIHFPDLTMALPKLLESKNYTNMATAVFLYLGGDAIGGKYGQAMKKGAEGLAIGTVAQHLLWWSTHSDNAKWAAFTATNGGGQNINISRTGYDY